MIMRKKGKKKRQREREKRYVREPVS